MFIVGCHPDNGSEPFVDPVPVMNREADSVLEAQKACQRKDVRRRSAAERLGGDRHS